MDKHTPNEQTWLLQQLEALLPEAEASANPEALPALNERIEVVSRHRRVNPDDRTIVMAKTSHVCAVDGEEYPCSPVWAIGQAFSGVEDRPLTFGPRRA